MARLARREMRCAHPRRRSPTTSSTFLRVGRPLGDGVPSVSTVPRARCGRRDRAVGASRWCVRAVVSGAELRAQRVGEWQPSPSGGGAPAPPRPDQYGPPPSLRPCPVVWRLKRIHLPPSHSVPVRERPGALLGIRGQAYLILIHAIPVAASTTTTPPRPLRVVERVLVFQRRCWSEVVSPPPGTRSAHPSSSLEGSRPLPPPPSTVKRSLLISSLQQLDSAAAGHQRRRPSTRRPSSGSTAAPFLSAESRHAASLVRAPRDGAFASWAVGAERGGDRQAAAAARSCAWARGEVRRRRVRWLRWCSSESTRERRHVALDYTP